MQERFYWGISIAILFILFAFFLEKYVFALLYRLSKKTACAADDIFIGFFKEKIGFWGILLSGYLFSHYFIADGRVLYLWRSVLLLLLIFSFARVLSGVAVALITVYAKKTPRIIPSTSIFINLTNSILFIAAVILALQSLGISITPILTALGVGGLAVALALQDTLSNFFAGLHLLIARPVRPRDYIRLDSGEEGYVRDITWRNTAIEDLMKNMIIVPNSKMTEAKIVNYNLPEKQMIIVVALAVDFDSDLSEVERIAVRAGKQAMRETNGTAAAPLVRFSGFGENSVEFQVSLRVRRFSSQYFLRHRFIQLLQQNFLRAGILLPESTHTVFLRARGLPVRAEDSGRDPN